MKKKNALSLTKPLSRIVEELHVQDTFYQLIKKERLRENDVDVEVATAKAARILR